MGICVSALFHGGSALITTVQTQCKMILSFIWKICKAILRYLLRAAFWCLRQSALLSACVENAKRKSEEPKRAFQKHRIKALGSTIIHSFPVAVTGVLLYLNFKGVFYEYPGNIHQNVRLNLFQLAAKVHEVLIVASISCIVLSFVQRCILAGPGLTFGTILANVEISDVACFIRPGFWAAVFSGQYSSHQVSLLALMIVSVLITQTSGPSSAVLVLPSLDWWPLVPGYLPTNHGRYFVGNPRSVIWPTQINSTTWKPANCTSAQSQLYDHCPTSGLPALLEWAGDFRGGLDTWNITVRTHLHNELSIITLPSKYMAGIDDEQLSEIPNLPDFGLNLNSSWTLFRTTTGIMDNMLAYISYDEVQAIELLVSGPQPIENLWDRWSMSQPNNQPAFGPSTFVGCNSSTDGQIISPAKDGKKPRYISEFWMPIRPTGAPPYHPITSMDLNSTLQSWYDSDYGDTLFWITPPDIGNSTPSIALLFLGYTYAMLCSVYAGWLPADSYVDTTDGLLYVHSSEINDVTSNLRDWYIQNATIDDFQQTFITKEWADTAIPANDTIARIISTVNNAAATSISSFSTPSQLIEMSASAFLTDVLSRPGINSEMIIDDGTGSDAIDTDALDPWSTNNTSPSSWTEVSVQRFRFGYAYSMRGATRWIAAGILLAHAAMALIHLVVIVWTGWYCETLKTPYELLALAVNSPETHVLDNTCVGMSRLDTYKHRVKIQETRPGHLSLVLNDQGNPGMGKYGEKYG